MIKEFCFPSAINLQSLINKQRNKPNRFKDHLYDNLSVFDKTNMIFNQKYGLLDHIFPKLNKILDVTNKILMILANIFWFIFTMIIGCFNVPMGVLGFFITFILFTFSIIYVVESEFQYEYEKGLTLEKIAYCIVSILSFSWLIDFLIILIVLFIFNGRSKVRKFVYKEIEKKFCDEFNEIYYDDQNVAYLKHEMLNEVSFDIEYNDIEYDYFYEYDNLYRIYQCFEFNQNERALVKYIKYHTNRELNFKQLLLKLTYLEQKSELNKSEQLIDQNKEDDEMIKLLIDNQKSEEELLRKQFSK